MLVKGENRRDDLGSEEKEDWDVKRRALDKNFSLDNHFGRPSRANDNRQTKCQPHFIEFKELGRVAGEDQGNEEKKSVEGEFDDLVGIEDEFHGFKIKDLRFKNE